jgi:hypothetical protein
MNFRKKINIFFIVLVVSLQGTAAAANSNREIYKNWLSAVDALATDRAFNPEQLSNVLGLNLKKVKSYTSAYDFYRTNPLYPNQFADVELRVSNKKHDVTAGFIRITFKKGGCVTKDEIIARYGGASRRDAAANQPKGSPVFLVYQHSWGALKFGFTQTQPACLATIVLDGTYSTKVDSTRKDAFFSKIRGIASEQAFDSKTVLKVTGVKINSMPRESSKYYHLYRSKAGSSDMFDEIELRLPKSRRFTGILIIDVHDSLKITKQDLLDRFGKYSRLDAPNPKAPIDVPTYFIYRYNWGSISFGFSRTRPKHLKDIIFKENKTVARK